VQMSAVFFNKCINMNCYEAYGEDFDVLQ